MKATRTDTRFGEGGSLDAGDLDIEHAGIAGTGKYCTAAGAWRAENAVRYSA